MFRIISFSTGTIKPLVQKKCSNSIYSENAYFIIDFRWPKEYIKSTLKSVKPDFLICDQELTFLDNFSLIDGLFLTNYEFKIYDSKILTNTHPANLAYVITTSGTTGNPKVIEVCNSSILPNITDLCKILQLEKSDIVYQASSLTFDPSLVEIFCSLNSECTLLILPQFLKMMPEKLNRILLNNKITTLQITPSLFKILDSKIFEQNQFKNLILGGENFPSNEKIRKVILNGKRVFNIYGLTELSSWSSCQLVTLKEIEDLDEVSIGTPLSETKFYLKTKDQLILFDSDLNANLIDEEFELVHFSQKRICYIDGKRKEFLESGDRAFLKNNKIYLKGRIDRIVKINGNLTDLNLLEMTLKQANFENSAFLLKENYIALVIFCDTTQIDKKITKLSIQNLISKKLPFNYQPSKIIFLNLDALPITPHGKLNYQKLKSIVNDQENEPKINLKYENYLPILSELWKNMLGKEPTDEDKFVLSGGNSLKALMLIDELEQELKEKFLFSSNANLILDALLNKKFIDFKKVFESLLNEEQSQNEEPAIKIPKLDTKKETLKKEELKFFSQNDLVCCFSKNFKFLNLNLIEKNIEKKTNLKTVWKVDTQKCVDATPLAVMKSTHSIRVFIGSHSNNFFCVDGITGNVIWTYQCDDRIESSACIDKSGNHVLFGSYDRNLYILNANNGDLYWKFQSKDLIKSSPCIDFETGFVYFGSYDKNIYCLDLERKIIVWERVLDGSSIFSGPTCDNKTSLFVTTLGGRLFSLNKNSGEINWQFKLEKPIFTSAIIDSKSSSLFLGTCGGYFYCIDFQGNLKWKFEALKPIFSNACEIDELILFCSHDHYLYCLDKTTGLLKWKFECEAEIYANPFYDIFNEIIICVNCDGTAFIFDKNGSLLNRIQIVEMKKSCYSSPLITNENIYIGSRDNNLICLQMY
ncbi:unnamed protein product [Brachionus calyciflorus]|uniref:Uncharacterized protein n=1 Tax=Brachionus calyciflorus TaxID=104777 RepID=A0A813MST5_9BILA|nr:unnamed protein product [Brachionus calyciflorus]